MGKFIIENRIKRVTFDQFKYFGQCLELYLRDIRPTLESEVFLTLSKSHFNENVDMLSLRSELDLSGCEKLLFYKLSAKDWRRSYETNLLIRDTSGDEPYIVSLETGVTEPKKLYFSSNGLDEKSQKVFDSFRKVNFFQRLRE